MTNTQASSFYFPRMELTPPLPKGENPSRPRILLRVQDLRTYGLDVGPLNVVIFGLTMEGLCSLDMSILPT